MSHDAGQLKTAEDIYSLMTKEVAGYMFNQVNRSLVDMAEIYRWVTGKKVSTTGSISCKTVMTDCFHRLLLRQPISRHFNKATLVVDITMLFSITAAT
jgi:hypothetical protein